MATDLGTLVYTLTLNDEGFSGQLTSAKEKVSNASQGMSGSLNETEKASKGLGGAFSSMAGQFVLGQAIFTAGQKALDLVTETIKDGIKADADWQQQQVALRSQLAATKDAIGLNAEQLTQMAEKTENNTGITREAALQSENSALVFSNIGKNVFPQFMTAVDNVAYHMAGNMIPNAQQLQATTEKLGRAFQDPTKYMGLLARSGIVFTDHQKEQIKTMQKAGDLQGAQVVMLDALKGRFGSATQALQTWRGEFQLIKDKMAEFIGNALNKLLDKLGQFADWVINNKPVLFAFAGALAGLGVAILVGVVPALAAMAVAAIAAMIPFIPFIAAGAAIGAIAYVIISNWSGISKFFTDVFKNIGNGVDWLKNHFWEKVGEILGFFITLPIMMPVYVIEAFVAIFNYIKNIDWNKVFKAIGDTFRNLWDSVVTMAQNTWKALTKINWGAILVGIGRGIGNAIIDLINGAIRGAFSGIPILKDHVPQIPHFSSGVENFGGGLAYVHAGELLTNLSPGTTVIPKNKVDGMMGGKTYNFDGAQFNFHTKESVDRFFSIGNRSTALEIQGISPLAGTTGA